MSGWPIVADDSTEQRDRWLMTTGVRHAATA